MPQENTLAQWKRYVQGDWTGFEWSSEDGTAYVVLRMDDPGNWAVKYTRASYKGIDHKSDAELRNLFFTEQMPKILVLLEQIHF